MRRIQTLIQGTVPKWLVQNNTFGSFYICVEEGKVDFSIIWLSQHITDFFQVRYLSTNEPMDPGGRGEGDVAVWAIIKTMAYRFGETMHTK